MASTTCSTVSPRIKSVPRHTTRRVEASPGGAGLALTRPEQAGADRVGGGNLRKRAHQAVETGGQGRHGAGGTGSTKPVLYNTLEEISRFGEVLMRISGP